MTSETETYTHPLISDPSNPEEPVSIDALADILGEEIDFSKGTVECKFTTGAAGTGKTYQFIKAIEEDATAGILCATTGVAAVNLGTTTLNSVLKYFKTEDLQDAYVNGRLVRRLLELSTMYKSLMIDEVSMMDGEQLDVITQAAIEANARSDSNHQLAIHLTGDFCQLPPVNAKWAFQSSHWGKYAANTTKLDKIWRQDNQPFIDALNLARSGNGLEAAAALRPMVKWSVAQQNEFQGTTIFAKNDAVNKFNALRYMQLQGKELRFKSARWGKLRKEWFNIPEMFNLKIGAYVMILTNGRKEHKDDQTIPYANGDQGYITEFSNGGVWVRLDRTGETHMIPFIVRHIKSKESPLAGVPIRENLEDFSDPRFKDAPYFDSGEQRWIYGGITYLPVRLAYAATVHKTQGLTLDNVQVDIRDHFFGSNNMAYVALSRVKSPQGLRVVGTPELLAKRIKIADEVKPWV